MNDTRFHTCTQQHDLMSRAGILPLAQSGHPAMPTAVSVFYGHFSYYPCPSAPSLPSFLSSERRWHIPQLEVQLRQHLALSCLFLSFFSLPLKGWHHPLLDLSAIISVITTTEGCPRDRRRWGLGEDAAPTRY